jgi:hypothetical protein
MVRMTTYADGVKAGLEAAARVAERSRERAFVAAEDETRDEWKLRWQSRVVEAEVIRAAIRQIDPASVKGEAS